MEGDAVEPNRVGFQGLIQFSLRLPRRRSGSSGANPFPDSVGEMLPNEANATAIKRANFETSFEAEGFPLFIR